MVQKGGFVIDFLLEKNILPDFLIRFGIRAKLGKKLYDESSGGAEAQERRFSEFLLKSRQSPVSIHAETANTQHYELPAEFFVKVLGPQRKYSSGYWPEGVSTLAAAEEAMLCLSARRAELAPGQKILDLGCGWGSFSLWMAGHYPESEILAVSNSKTQKIHIDEEAARLGLKNLRVVTAEMSEFSTEERFDRIVSVEMFEHMRNYEKLFEKTASFLKEGGKAFVHVFTHRKYAYFYESSDPGDWIGRYFFTGGTMPSDNLFLHFQKHWVVENHWRISGKHYQKTCRQWLLRMDSQKKEIFEILKKNYGEKDCLRWWVYWRVFFMSCEELFGYRGGREWMVSHYLFKKR